jgi:UDP-2,3-diacylglucosamine pyrophosphatase LpxH
LVLNGDIIDIWQFRKSYFPKSHLKVIKKIIDLAMTKGVNYPKGLFQWGKEWGFDKVNETLQNLMGQYQDDRYRSSSGLKNRV